MIKLESLRNKKGSNNGGNPAAKKSTAAQLRITKDLSEIEASKTFQTVFPDPDDLLFFKLYIQPDEGFYKGGKFSFSIKISSSYPHEAPKVKCDNRVYHPNIDLEGNVCLNILREDWKPVLSISAVIYGVQFLLLEPNPDDPLNKEAADALRSNRRVFEQNVYKSLRGGSINNVRFDRLFH